MLRIRPEQLVALQRGSRENFAAEIAPLLSRKFRLAGRVLDRAAVRRAAAAALERAAALGFERRNDLYDFAHLAFVLGAELDDDPLIPWAGEILRRDADPSANAALLWRRASLYLRQVNGPDGIDGVLALARARRIPFETFAGAETVDDLLRRVHPRRRAALSEEQLRASARRGCEVAARNGILPSLWLALMLLLGSRFDRDPLHAWAAEALRTAETDVLTRSRALHAAATMQFDRLFKGL
ncbi:MAG TPA: hypothetical protein VGR02_02505 [Thermoanaerobaculia bacterium]|jgi:hypothetical protein|nr:hypothetical protein [Thermoanaerobaculia bacterium]